MVLREAFDYEFSSLDPTGAHIDPPSIAVYETLVAKGPDWRARPLLAESWSVEAGGLEWVVRLREGLRFHSGAACDADAVLRALELLRWQVPGERQLWYWDPVDKVRAVDARTLRFRLHHPYPRLPALLWGTHTAIHNEALRAADPERFGSAVADGTGPFRLVSWSPNRVVAERWPEYPGERAGLACIDWLSIVDEADRLRALEQGEVDCLHGPPLGQVDRLRADSRFVVDEHCQASNMYVALDWRRTELGFDDLRVRRAVSLAIDRSALVAEALAGHGTPTWGPLPPGDEFYDPIVDAEGRRDLAGAAALLDEAGWTVGLDGVRLAFECVVQEDDVFRRVAELVATQFAEVGIALELRYVKAFADFYAACAAGPASSISKWLWQDPMDAIIGFSSTGTLPFPNWAHASVPELDRAYDAWLRAETDAGLHEAAGHAQAVFARTLPYVPLLTPNDVWVWRRELRGYRPYPANLYPFYQGVTLVTGQD